MLKRLLLALDDTPASLNARSLALALAQHHDAALRGLAVVDPDAVTPGEPTPIGGDAFKQHKDSVILERARAAAAALAQSFADACRTAHVEAEAGVVQGRPLAALIDACAPHDIVVVGNDTSFGAGETAPSALIAGLLSNNPRPLIVTPAGPATGARTLVAYDGSIPAMRALQLFCALGLRKERETVVMSVAGDDAEAKAKAEAGEAFLRERGYNAVARHAAGADNPVDAIIAAAKSADAGLLVAGAYGRRGWREWLLGTTTEQLISKSAIPLFIHH